MSRFNLTNLSSNAAPLTMTVQEQMDAAIARYKGPITKCPPSPQLAVNKVIQTAQFLNEVTGHTTIVK